MASRSSLIPSWILSRRNSPTPQSSLSARPVSELGDNDYVQVSIAPDSDHSSGSSPPLSRSASAILNTSPAKRLKAIMGGKSNRFDFTNRTSGGPKLGKSIGQTLEKEAAKLRKDSDKQLAKAEKSARNSSGADISPGDTKEHSIDFKAPDKDLTDEGFAFVAVGLTIALNTKTATVSLTLVDLNISGNKLNTTSLAKLAPIIACAQHTLKTLDLANNHIVIDTDKSAAEFESFLRAFKDCLVLRRLDLSRNHIGAKGFEIFAKVYLSEEKVHPIPPTGNASVVSLHSAISDPLLFSPTLEGVEGFTRDSLDSFDPMTRAQILRRRCGLRSIPYITLQDVDLDDAGALWLSYIVELHYYPIQLTDKLNAAAADTAIRAYAQDAELRGIDYTKNSTLGKEGIYMLNVAELVRQALYDDWNDRESVSIDSIAGIPTEEDLRRISFENHLSRAAAGARRTSIRSIHTADGGEHENSELESIRKRVQRHVIEGSKWSSVEIWNAAFEVFWIARKLIYMGPKIRRHYVGEPIFNFGLFRIGDRDRVDKKRTAPYLPETFRTHRMTGRSMEATLAYAQRMLIFPDVDQEITETTNVPAAARQMKPSNANGAENDPTRMSGTVLGDGVSPRRFILYQQRRIDIRDDQGVVYRTKTSTGLPFEVIDRILFFALSQREYGALSSVQKKAAVEWGSDKTTFQEEEKWAKYADSYQVWTLLEKMQGLEYAQ